MKKEKRKVIISISAVVLAVAIGIVGFALAETGIIPEELRYKAGVVAGVLFGVALFFVLVTLSKRRNAGTSEFDERQNITKGIAARKGFATMVALLFVLILFELLEISIPIEKPVLYFLVVLSGALVVVCYNIWNDAYFALNENKTFIICLLILMAAINGVIGFMNLIGGSLVVDGVLTSDSLNLIVSVFMLVILAVIAVKHLRERQGDDEE